MTKSQAIDIWVPNESDMDQGEGRLIFTWADPIYGREGLEIDDDGHCARRMPIRSGMGPPTLISLARESIRIRFPPQLAARLELDEEIEIQFTLTETDFKLLREFVERW